tara:strand:- start:251 stop:451 length:201 start_codon:yes stop_codon:yes gene_type:complete
MEITLNFEGKELDIEFEYHPEQKRGLEVEPLEEDAEFTQARYKGEVVLIHDDKIEALEAKILKEFR